MLPQIDARGRAVPGAFGREEAGAGMADGGGCGRRPCLAVSGRKRMVACSCALPIVVHMPCASFSQSCIMTLMQCGPPAHEFVRFCRDMPGARPHAGRRQKRTQRYEGGERSRYFADDDATDLQAGGEGAASGFFFGSVVGVMALAAQLIDATDLQAGGAASGFLADLRRCPA